jgi:uncharacterized protein (UPF0332 family)
MTLNETDKATMISYRIEQAEETIKEAELLISNKMYRAANNRIYYGIFYALLAIALKQDFSTSKHSQLIGWFNKTFIAPEILNRELGKTISRIFESRIKGDYDSFITISENEINSRFSEMKTAIQQLKDFILKRLN